MTNPSEDPSCPPEHRPYVAAQPVGREHEDAAWAAVRAAVGRLLGQEDLTQAEVDGALLDVYTLQESDAVHPRAQQVLDAMAAYNRTREAIRK